MKTLQLFAAIATLVSCAAGAAPDQPAPARGPCAAASSPALGCDGARGPGMQGPGGHADTSGWDLMSPQERRAYRERMASFRSYDDCQAYREAFRQNMAQRAKARGQELPPAPRGDGCAALKAKPAN